MCKQDTVQARETRSKLDEMQEQKLLQLEHAGFWLVYWGLLAAILVQLVTGAGLRELAGEWGIFLIASVYLVAGCLKNGIWDRKLPATRKTNVLASLIAAAVVGIVTAAILLFRFPACGTVGLIAGIAGATATTFLATFALLSLFLSIYKKRVKSLEDGDGSEKQ